MKQSSQLTKMKIFLLHWNLILVKLRGWNARTILRRNRRIDTLSFCCLLTIIVGCFWIHIKEIGGHGSLASWWSSYEITKNIVFLFLGLLLLLLVKRRFGGLRTIRFENRCMRRLGFDYCCYRRFVNVKKIYTSLGVIHRIKFLLCVNFEFPSKIFMF